MQLQNEYVARRDRYDALARERALTYSEGTLVDSLRERLRSRGYTVARKSLGGVHTFAFIPRLGWHDALYPDLRVLGPVTEFDYVGEGMGSDAPETAEHRGEINAVAFQRLRTAHDLLPVDWVFIYGSGREIGVDFVRRITDELGIPVVTMCLDDKQSWSGQKIGNQHAGQVDLAPWSDLSWTSARVACEWYLAEGGRPFYQPEGFDSSTCRPLAVEQDIPVSFIGNAYGFRTELMRDLEHAGIPVAVYGEGWARSSPVFGDRQIEVINRSVINLGAGGIGYHEALRNVKTRDFEIPGTGGGVYLTSFNADLAQHFHIGEEIACYGSRFELVELIRHYLRHREEARLMARRARERCLTEHRWLHRYQRVLEILGVLSAAQ